MPVAEGGLSTRLAVNETNLVPRSRSSSRTGGRLDGRSVGRRGSCLATPCPAALQAHEAAGLQSGFRPTVGARRCFGRFCRGLATVHTPPNVTRNLFGG